MGIALILVFAIALLVGPIAAEIAGFALATTTQVVLMVSGLLLAVASGALLLVTKLYQKTKASESFVRTGMGGFKIVKDGGAIVIPVLHRVVTITLRTLKFEVQRMGKHALLTSDKLRADIGAEFFVRVMPDDDSIAQAARSFGEHMSPEEVERLVLEKAVSALRTVAATKTLEELNSNRDDFMREVQQIVGPDLQHNGLTLETATISTLDQTSTENLDPNNVFDAEGLETIARITQLKMTERNRLEREGEQARKDQDVQTRKRILDLEQDEEAARATQAAEVQKVQAERSREAREKAIEATRQVELAAVQKQQAVEVAAQRQQQAVEVANRERQQAVEVAEQQKLEATTRAQKEVEVAARAKQEAVAAAEREVALAETEKAQAEAEREAARQRVATVAVVEEAERQRRQEVIAAEAAAQKDYVRREKLADAEAYSVTKDAEARKQAADADAEAVRKKAEAERDAQTARAAGDRAVALVPVQVEAERVAVAKRNVEEVVKPELEAREQHGKVAQDFELAKLRITKEAEVRIATAEAAATVFQKIDAKLYGTPDQVAQMTDKLLRGHGIGELANGLMDSLEPPVVQAGLRAAAAVLPAVRAVGDRLRTERPAAADAGTSTAASDGETPLAQADAGVPALPIKDADTPDAA